MEYAFFKKKDRWEKLIFENVLWIEGAGSSVVVVVKDLSKKGGVIKHCISGNLKTIKKQILNPSFIRVHRSYVINLKHVEAIDGRRLLIHKELIPFNEGFYKQVPKLFPVLRTSL